MRRLYLMVALLAVPAAAQDIDMHMSSGIQSVELHFAGNLDFRKSFGDLAGPSAYSIGPIDSLISARLSETISFLSEIVFEGRGAEGFGLDAERITLSWEPRRWFRLSAGRFHTPLGYWNVAFHHAKWMATTVDAPLLMRYEDQQGPLPMHTIGLLAHGSIPLGRVRLEYEAATGNGRGATSDPPQSFQDINEGKSAVAALHLVAGDLRLGVSGLLDQTHKGTPTGPRQNEQIGAADLRWGPGALEFLAEGALIHQSVAGGPSSTDMGGYVQLSYGVTEQWRPYARVEHFEHDAANDYLPTPTTTEVLGGLRFDPISPVALKLEGAWVRVTGVDQPAVRAQLSWLF